jgi:hypothetical protein
VNLLNPSFKYYTAEETRKPNYLREKFKRIRESMGEGVEVRNIDTSTYGREAPVPHPSPEQS